MPGRQRPPAKTTARVSGDAHPSSIAGEMSAPITKPDAPTIGSAISAASPVPAETSSIRDPDATSAAESTDGTKSRDHRPMYRSYADALTARPGATWKPARNLSSLTASRDIAPSAIAEIP